MASKRKRDRIITFWATGDDYERLRKLADERDCPVAQILRAGMRRELAAAKEAETAQLGG